MEHAVRTIRISDLFPNPWNTNVVSPENQSKIEESVRRFGMFKPLVVRTLTDGRLEILGGQHRWEAAKALGIEQVEVVDLGQIDDKKAKEISLVDNGRYGVDDGLRLSELLRELGDVEEYLPYSEADLNQIFTAATVDFDSIGMEEESDAELEKKVEELTRKAPDFQIMRFKVPVADAQLIKDVIDGIIKLQGLKDSDSLVNAGDALVFLCGRLKDET